MSPQPGRSRPFAIASLLSGIVGLFFAIVGVGLVPGIAAIVLSQMAHKRGGDFPRVRLAGLITGIASFAIGTTVLVVVGLYWAFAYLLTSPY